MLVFAQMNLKVFIFDGDKLSVSEDLESIERYQTGQQIWVDLETSEPQHMSAIAERFSLHELAIDDSFTRGHFPKMEDFPSHIFLMLRGLKNIPELEEMRSGAELDEEYNSERLTRSVSIYLGENFLITHRLYEVSWLDAVVRKFSSEANTQTINFRPQELVLQIADTLTTRFVRGVEYFEDEINDIEEQAISEPVGFEIMELLDLKRDLNILQNINRDQLRILMRLSSDAKLIPNKRLRRYFKNVEDRSSTIAFSLQSLIDNLSSVRDAYFAMSNVRLGDIMRILAVITTIAAPLHLVVGLYGMNFEVIPLLHKKYGFWIILGTMITVVGIMLAFFKRKKWI